jgi:hypothetical protein
MRSIEVVKYRKLLQELQQFCSEEKHKLSHSEWPKQPTDFERGTAQGKHSAFNKILKELHKMIDYADVDWEHTQCRDDDNFKR